MSNTEEKYKRLLKLAKQEEQEKAELQGELNLFKKQLKEKGYDSIKVANAALQKLSKTIDSDKQSFESLIESFEKEFKDELQKLNR